MPSLNVFMVEKRNRYGRRAVFPIQTRRRKHGKLFVFAYFPQRKKIDPKRNYECTICLEEYTGSKMKEIICGHMFCKDCWKGYLEVTINEGQVTGMQCFKVAFTDDSVIACPGRDCNTQLDEVTITKMLGERKKGKELLEKYHMLIANAYVNVRRFGIFL
jgi:hypothetical protein